MDVQMCAAQPTACLVRAEREGLGLTQQALADLAGISRRTLIDIENCAGYLPNGVVMVALVRALGKRAISDLWIVEPPNADAA